MFKTPSGWLFDIHPGKLTWNIIMEVWKTIFLSKWVIYMFHVNLPGCRGLYYATFFFLGGGGDSFISQLIRNPEAEPIRMTHGDNVTCGQYMLLRVCFFFRGERESMSWKLIPSKIFKIRFPSFFLL